MKERQHIGKYLIQEGAGVVWKVARMVCDSRSLSKVRTPVRISRLEFIEIGLDSNFVAMTENMVVMN
jgi:hypothetical protein